MKAEEKINTFVIENKSSKYKLSLEGGEREIKFHLEELESLPKITFEENFTLESLKQKSKFFRFTVIISPSVCHYSHKCIYCQQFQYDDFVYNAQKYIE